MNFYATPEQWERWALAAQSSGLSVSEWMRRRLDGDRTIRIEPAPRAADDSQAA